MERDRQIYIYIYIYRERERERERERDVTYREISCNMCRLAIRMTVLPTVLRRAPGVCKIRHYR